MTAGPQGAKATGRDDILGKIRRKRENRAREDSTREDSAGEASMAAVDRRLRDHPANLVPQRGQIDLAGRLALFQAEAEKVDATVARLSGPADVPGEVARYLKASNLGTRIKIAPSLSGYAWADTLLEVEPGAAVDTDVVSVTEAFAGVAETGTLVACSGSQNPTTLHFLPPNAIILVAASDMAGSYEEVWQRLRGTVAPEDAFMPRTVNFITGPSRSADIEQTLLLGAHGPQRLHIIVVEDEKPET